MRARSLLVATLVIGVAGCAVPGAGSQAPGQRQSQAPALTLTRVAGTPARRTDAAIAVAFDEASAAELISPLPAELDLATDALLCVYLGERPTGGWGLALQSAALRDGELRILARETRPRGNVTQAVTYPGDCASVPRAALPAGELAVRADDTISDEFIVDGRIEVPRS
ncbi:MAG: protease complex subunit PrcB family protein [Chloroflexota bacterium]